MGMGHLHTTTAAAQTEDSLYESAVYRDPNVIHTDYLHGRMMKTTFEINADGTLSISPKTPRIDYQSWGSKYKTADELIKAVDDSFN